MIIRVNSWRYKVALLVGRLVPNIWILATRVGQDTSSFVSVTWGKP
jgi:hypothetical protein